MKRPPYALVSSVRFASHPLPSVPSIFWLSTSPTALQRHASTQLCQSHGDRQGEGEERVLGAPEAGAGCNLGPHGVSVQRRLIGRPYPPQAAPCPRHAALAAARDAGPSCPEPPEGCLLHAICVPPQA